MAQPISPEDALRLAALGWLTPSTAAQIAPPVAAPPVMPSQLPPMPPLSDMNLAAVSAGRGSLIPPTTPVSAAPVGAAPAGTGLSHAAPVIPGMPAPGQPGYTPPPTEAQLLAQANAGAQAPKPPQAADLKRPTAPEGTLPGDAGTVSAPIIRRPGGPTPAQPGIVGGGSVGPVKPPDDLAAGEYLQGLQDLQKREADRGDRLVSAFEDQQLAEREKNVAVASGRLEAAAVAERQMQESTARLAAAREQADSADRDSRERAYALANKKVDPNNYWNSKSTGEKILGSLALALGAFGSALTKTPNFAFQMMENAIDRDIGAQRDNIANAKDSAAMLDKLGKDKYGRAMSGYELESRQRLDSYNYALQKVDAASAKYDDPIAKAKADAFKVQLQEKIDQTKQNISTNIFEVKSAQEAALARQRAAAASADAAGAKEQKEQVKAYRDLVQKNMENGDNLQIAQARALAVMGGPGAFKGNLPALPGKPEGGPQPIAGDPLSIVPKHQQTDALKEQAAVANTEKSIEGVNKLFDKWKEGSSGVIPSVTGSQRSVVQASVKTTVKRGAGPGMSSDSDREQFIDPLVPQLGDSDETLERKRQQIIDGLRGSSPSPILDRYSPGWRKLSEVEATEAGKTQFGFKPTAK